MADKSLLDLAAIADQMQEADEIYVNRGGIGGDKRMAGNRIIPAVVVQDTTGSIDLATFFGDVVVFSTPASAITITLSNNLTSGRKLTIINKSSTFNVLLAGGSTSIIPNNGLINFVSDGSALFEVSGTNAQITDNLLINGTFRFAQEGASGVASFTAATLPANNDDTYLLDQWIQLSDGNDVADISQDTDVPNNKGLAMKSIVATPNKKWGFFQPLENERIKQLENGKVSLRIHAKTTSAKIINNIRIAVVSWDGAKDVITSDIISGSNWNASGVDPTLAANWTYENAPSDLALTTSYQAFTINSVDIDTAGMKNFGLFIWVDDTDAAAGDELFLAECSMNEGVIFKEVEYRDFGIELFLCQKFVCKSYDLDKPLADASTNGKIQVDDTNADNGNTAVYSQTTTITYPTTMRVAPTISTWGNGAEGQVSIREGGTFSDRVKSIANAGQHHANVGTTSTLTSISHGIRFHYLADARL